MARLHLLMSNGKTKSKKALGKTENLTSKFRASLSLKTLLTISYTWEATFGQHALNAADCMALFPWSIILNLGAEQAGLVVTYITIMSKLDFAKAVEQEKVRLQVLHPTPEDIPGCIRVFDDYLACNAVRNQIKSVYRFGKRSACDLKLDEFKFCLSLKAMHPEEQREAWIDRRAEWWARRRVEKSSEDIWDIRDKPLENFPKHITDDFLREAGYGSQA